jgi:hypothetical protein
MPALARADLERLLQARKLGPVVTPPAGCEPDGQPSAASTGLASLDDQLGGGWPRGHVSEVVGPSSAGASWIAGTSLAAATRRGEWAALVDPLDVFDPETAASAGFVWPRLLWVRGQGRPEPRAPSPPPRVFAAGCFERRAASGERRVNWRPVVDSALKAFALVIQAEGFGLAVLDLRDVPARALASLPFTTWRRLQRMIEGRDIACLVTHTASLARSAGGVTLALEPPDGGRVGWQGGSPRSQRFSGLAARTRPIRAAWQAAALEGRWWRSDE